MRGHVGQHKKESPSFSLSFGLTTRLSELEEDSRSGNPGKHFTYKRRQIEDDAANYYVGIFGPIRFLSKWPPFTCCTWVEPRAFCIFRSVGRGSDSNWMRLCLGTWKKRSEDGESTGK